MSAPFSDYVAGIEPGEDFAIFPLAPNTKEPLPGSHGYKDATANTEQLRAWAAEWPDANIGHSPGDSGHWVLDVDPRNGGTQSLAELELKHGRLPETFTVLTPSGGRHYWFKGSAPSGTIGKGLDVKGRGGYVLQAGSIVNGREYTVETDTDTVPAPAWLFDLANAPKRDAQAAPADIEPDSPGNRDRAIAFLKARAPAIEGQGGDAHTVKTAMELRDLGLNEATALALVQEHWNARCEPPWEPDELAVKVGNAYLYGGNEPGAYAVANPQVTFAEFLKTLPRKRTNKFRVLLGPDMRNLPEPSWLVDGIFPSRGLVLLYGPSDSYKTFAALDVALSVATGLPAFGSVPVAKGGAIICAGESPLHIARSRRTAWAIARHVGNIDAVPFGLVRTVPLVSDSANVDALIAEIHASGLKPSLVAIDTAARAMGGLDENSAKDAGLLIAAAEKIRDEFDCTLLLVHHSGKDEDRGARGSSALEAAVDTVLLASADRDARTVTLKVKKQKDADPGPPIYLQGREVERTLVFSKIAADEHAAVTRKNHSVLNAEVGAALQELKAIHGETVTTHVLAFKLAGPEADRKTIQAKERALNRHADSRLAAYIAHRGEGRRGDPTLWTFPRIEGPSP